MPVNASQIRIVHSMNIAGTFMPEGFQKQPNTALVILTHGKEAGKTGGCGARDHLPGNDAHKIAHTVDELYQGLELHGIKPAAYFGMEKPALAQALAGARLESSAHEGVATLFEKARATGLPVIVGAHAHTQGRVTGIKTANLGRLNKHEPINLVVSTCSDARSDGRIAIPLAQALIGHEHLTEFELPDEQTHLFAENSSTQQPAVAMVHDHRVTPDKKRGAIFAVSTGKHFDLLARVSLAYAIMSFGPRAHEGPKSLGKIDLTNAGAQIVAEASSALTGLQGIKVER